MTLGNPNKNRLQQELEKLSWQFMVEENQPKEIKDDVVFLEEIDEPAIQKEVEPEVEDNYSVDDELAFLYSRGDYGVNDMGRNSGIVFDEDKLEQTRVTEWHGADKLRYSWLERLARGIGMTIIWPFKMVYLVVAYFFRCLFGILEFFGDLIYRAIRAVVLLPWQILVAFKYAFIYLFGDFSWVKREAVPVRVEARRGVGGLGEGIVWRRVTVFAVVAIVLVLPLQAYITYSKAQGVKGAVLGASELGLTHLYQASQAGKEFDFQSAGEEFNLAEAEFMMAQESVLEMGLLANSIGKFIPDVEAGKQLLAVAQLSAQIGQHLSKVGGVWGEVSAAMEGTNDQENKIDWAEAENEVNLAFDKAYQVATILNQVDFSNTQFDGYQEKLNELKQRMPELVGWLSESRSLFQVMTHFMGIDQPRRWMFVFQNNSELRPTGGFMGSYAIVDVKNGKIINIDVPGGGFYDLKGSLSVAVDAPYPFHLFSSVWQPWNANWFPDFPASAEKIMWFYDKSGGSTIDGVVAFTPNVLEGLLALVGEIEMEEYETTVNADNFVRMAQIEVELEYDQEENQPKKFIGDLLPIILERLMELPEEKLIDAWQVMSDSLVEKHLLIYLSNDQLQEKIVGFGWAGEIGQSEHDYLAVIHTNVAGGKTDRVMKTKIEHQVELLADGTVVDTVSLTKTHQGDPEDVFEGHVNTDYVRFYVPQGSRLLAAEGFDSIPEDREFKIAAVEPDPHLTAIEQDLEVDVGSDTRITNQFGKTVFANWMSVAPGEEKTVRLKYLLPFRYDPEMKIEVAVVEQDYSWWDLVKQYFFGTKEVIQEKAPDQVYSLLIQKQAGTDGIEFVSNLSLANNWQVGKYLPRDVEVGENLNYQAVLDTDKYYGFVLESR